MLQTPILVERFNLRRRRITCVRVFICAAMRKKRDPKQEYKRELRYVRRAMLESLKWRSDQHPGAKSVHGRREEVEAMGKCSVAKRRSVGADAAAGVSSDDDTAVADSAARRRT